MLLSKAKFAIKIICGVLKRDMYFRLTSSQINVKHNYI